MHFEADNGKKSANFLCFPCAFFRFLKLHCCHTRTVTKIDDMQMKCIIEHDMHIESLTRMQLAAECCL